MRTLVIQTSFLGDMVLTTPLLSQLAVDDEVDVIGTPAATALLANHPAVHQAISFDKRGRDAGITGFLTLARRLRAAKYDRAILAQGSARSGALALAAGIPQRIGFDTSAGRAFYTKRAPYIENEHHATRLLRLAGGADIPAPRPSLYPGPTERHAVDELLRDVPSASRLVAVAPGSVWATKRWPYFRELVTTLANAEMVVVVGAAGDAAALPAMPGRIVDATGRLSLLGSAELIRRCAVLVTNDSAPQHLASAMNTPTVAIFGPTVPEFGFGPLATRATTVGLDGLACRPCDRHGPVACPLGHWKCMRDVAVADVLAAIENVTR